MKYQEMLLNVNNDPSKILEFLNQISESQWELKPESLLPDGIITNGANDEQH